MRTALSLLMMLVLAVPVNAQMTSAALAYLCSEKNDLAQSLCKVYITGLAEGIWEQKRLLCDVFADCSPSLKKKATFCLPEYLVTFEQMAEIFLQHEKSRKPKKDDTAPREFLVAMKKAYPCPMADEK